MTLVITEPGQPYPAAPVQPRILERPEHPVSRRDIDPRVLKVLYRLIKAGHTAYLVGGGVRDLMLERKPKDFDVATSAHPHEVRELFRNSRLIGRRFRLVHVFFGPHNIEVATFRRRAEDVAESDEPLIRHDNTFGTAEEDAFRRDFTVNALFYDPQSFRVIDYVGGVADLEARLIRTIGDPELRMREDPVRMLRAVRFAAKLGFEIEPATRAAIERHRADLLKASVPRLVEEIYRAFGIAAAARALELMCELGLLEILLPPLAAFLRAGATPPSGSATARNLAAMGRRISAGAEPTHALVLACLFADLYLGAMPGGQRPDLVSELRLRGFPRADAERMRLVLEALPHLMAPGRRTRRLLQRPYFAEARWVYEIVAPTYGVDPATLADFLRAPDAFLAERGGEPRRGEAHREPGAGEPRRRRRGRRGRRGGRGRHRRHPRAAAAQAARQATEDDAAQGGHAHGGTARTHHGDRHGPGGYGDTDTTAGVDESLGRPGETDN
ncbi:MAG TPA: polynucleotide adenylyltransferase PcnB [Candidatus Binataceae bacterium]|jgi:poly(A) polymerase|nr:polynucleotide adenylyltransferase PcnB [Candidatus Binataceae bacterium]